MKAKLLGAAFGAVLGLWAVGASAATLVYSAAGTGFDGGPGISEILIPQLPLFRNEPPVVDSPDATSFTASRDVYTAVFTTAPGTFIDGDIWFEDFLFTYTYVQTPAGWEQGPVLGYEWDIINIPLVQDGDSYVATFSAQGVLVTQAQPGNQLWIAGLVPDGYSGADIEVAGENTPFTLDIYADAVPEPTTWLLMTFGLVLAGAALRARRVRVVAEFPL